MEQIGQVKNGDALDTWAQEIEVKANRSFWLLITFQSAARDLDISMLVARVHKDDEQSEQFTVNACGCMAKIDAARKSELT